MPLHFASEPKGGAALVSAGMQRLAARQSPLSKRVIDFNALQVTQPHAVYDIRADQIANGEGLAAARNTSFRYLVQSGGDPVAAAEVQTDASGIATLLANINDGPFVEASARALAALAKLDRIHAVSFEARFLRSAAVQVVAIWLKSDTDNADLIYPLAPAPQGVHAEKLYTVDDFLAAIMPIAKKRAANNGSQAVS